MVLVGSATADVWCNVAELVRQQVFLDVGMLSVARVAGWYSGRGVVEGTVSRATVEFCNGGSERGGLFVLRRLRVVRG